MSNVHSENERYLQYEFAVLHHVQALQELLLVPGKQDHVVAVGISMEVLSAHRQQILLLAANLAEPDIDQLLRNFVDTKTSKSSEFQDVSKPPQVEVDKRRSDSTLFTGRDRYFYKWRS